MDESLLKRNNIENFLHNDASLLTSDEDIAIHIMHRFNIDRETLETLPAFNEPLRSLLWPEKK
jgi:hypothetical protein